MSLPRLCYVLILLAAGVASAQTLDTANWHNLDWRLIGPFRAGRVLAVTGVPGERDHFYFGSVNGGVWETHDAGRTWNPIFDNEPVASIGAIAVAPSNPKIVYVGTGESDMRSDIAQGEGIYKSSDAGKTWKFTGLRDSQQIARILIDPKDPAVVYVAALGHPYGPNAERGVFRSRDGGRSWKKVLGPDPSTGAIDLAFKPGNPKVIYAALWQTRRPPWNIYPPSNGPGSGLYKSTDGGEHWKHISGHGFPGHVGRLGIALSAAMPQRVYAIVDGDKGGLYRSDDEGKTWKHVSSDHRIWNRGWYFGQITADPKNPDRVYALNTIVLRSDDGGSHFIALKGDPTGDDFHELWIDQKDPQRRILGVDQGAQVTLNGGKTWSTWYNQPTAQIYHISTDNRFPYWVYGAQQDSGAVALPSRGPSHDGITMREFTEVTAGGESDNIAPDPDDPQIIFGGRVDKLDMHTNQSRNVDPTLAYPGVYRGAWTLPLTFSTRKPHVLYFGNQHIFATSDGGEHWQPISGDLTRPNPAVPKNLDAPTMADNLGLGPRRGVVYAIAPSPLKDGLIWAGTDDGLIWHTTDSGKHWSNVTPKALTAWSKVGIISPSPFDAAVAYAAVDRHRLDDRHPYIYRTDDAGKTWKLIVGGLPTTQPVNVVRADPVRKGLLYAGTERGVFVSFDDGAHWQSLQHNLPVTSVRDIAIHGADLILATHGRGIWIMDDVSSLRQFNDTAEMAGSWLFAPAPTYRVRIPQFTGTPLPKDEPMAPNPPFGAYIDYRLAKAATKPVTLDILDGKGEPVRHYSSADQPPKPDAFKSKAAPEWTGIPSSLTSKAGTHRFVWPLHYAALPDGGKPDPYADGIWAPPGTYRVVLTVDGHKLTQPLKVLPDPRVKLSGKDYQAQFALAHEIARQASRVAVATHQAAETVEALAHAQLKARGNLKHRIESASRRVQDLSGNYTVPNPLNSWYLPAKTTHTLRYLSTSLASLQQAVDGADAAPSVDAQNGFKALQPIAESTLSAWQKMSTDLARLNKDLGKAGFKPVPTMSDAK